MNTILQVHGLPRHYAWGGIDFIPSLFTQKNKDGQPYAEWWLGAHPDQPSLIVENGETKQLNQWLKENPLSQSEQEREGDELLPFLLKVLDVEQMLAIQVHPNKQQAIEGYAKEEEKGIAGDAFERSYKDTNHKPEMMVALTPSWLAHGFASIKLIGQTLSEYPSLCLIEEKLNDEGIQSAFEYAMSAEQSTIDGWLIPVIDANTAAYYSGELVQSQSEYWVCKAFHKYASGCDKGLLALLMMNIVYVPPGKGIFQEAGVPHAYLSGQNIELMTNSDNVVRVGPTKLYVDIEEVFRLIDYRSVEPKLLVAEQAGSSGLLCYEQDSCSEFKLSMIRLTNEINQLNYQSQHLSLLLVTQGEAVIEENGLTRIVQKGDSFIITANTVIDLKINKLELPISKPNNTEIKRVEEIGFSAFVASFGE